MANWKIQDIAPPQKAKKEKQAREFFGMEDAAPPKEEIREVRAQKTPGLPKRGIISALVLLLVLAIGSIHIFFAKAEITLWPQGRTIKVLQPIVASVNGGELGTIAARTLSEEKEATRLFEASSKTLKENRASGIIRVFNAYTTSPQTLIAKTRFVSQDNKLFRTPKKITIPGASQQGGKLVPGFLDVEVVAAEPGEDYNIGPSNFSLPGLSGSASYTAIYAESTESMSGGSERETPVVSQEDIENAKEALIAELTQKATQDMLSRVPEGMVASKDAVLVDVVKADSLVQAGAEIKEFGMNVALTATAYLFSKAELDELVEEFVEQELKEDELVATDTTRVAFENVVVQQEGKQLSLDLGMTAVAYKDVDPTELKIKLRGKPKSEAASILASFDAFREAEVSLWPFWISSIPGNVDKLQVRQVLDQ